LAALRCNAGGFSLYIMNMLVIQTMSLVILLFNIIKACTLTIPLLIELDHAFNTISDALALSREWVR
jgi:hypothetical protein